MKIRKMLILLLITSLTFFLISCGGKEDEKEELPDVSEHIIKDTTDSIKDNLIIEDINRDIIKDAHIKVKEEGKIIIAIQVITEIPEEEAKEIGENAARLLASSVDGLEGPSKDYLGELYDYYSLQVGVGTDAENFIVQGAKIKGAKKITW